MKKVLVVAPAYTRSGYGEMARFALRALREHEDKIDVYLNPIIWGQTGGLENYLDEEYEWMQSLRIKTENYIRSGGQFDMSIQITIPNEFKKLAPVNIGYTAGIETTHISPAWLEPSNMMDKIIVISEHARTTFVNTVFQDQQGRQVQVTTPVETVHLPYREASEEELQLNLTTNTNFLSVVQWGPRKNVEQLIETFLQTFKDDPDVGLILKTNRTADHHIDRESVTDVLKSFRKLFPDAKCKLYLLHGTLTNGQLKSVYTNPKVKAFITATHGEGYGLPLFEAACNDLPVIATNWSGHLDFLKIDGKEMFSDVKFQLAAIPDAAVWQGVMDKGTGWAYPDTLSLKKRMLEIKSGEYTRIKARAVKLGKHVRETFTKKRLNNLFVSSVFGEEYVVESSITIDQLPKISIITSVFNGEEYIEGFMKDITEQTIFKEKCELIMVDCSSSGNEGEVIKRYQKEYPDNIKYIKLDKDPGIYAAWNLAIRESTGEFITNANLDDRKMPNSLEKHAKQLLINKDAELVYSDSYIVHESNTDWRNLKKDAQRYNFEEFSPKGMLRGNLPHNNPMWRRSLHDRFGYFNETYRSASDWEFWLTCVVGGCKFKKVDSVLGIYYFNPKGISTNFENFSWKQKEEDTIFEKFSALINQNE